MEKALAVFMALVGLLLMAGPIAIDFLLGVKLPAYGIGLSMLFGFLVSFDGFSQLRHQRRLGTPVH